MLRVQFITHARVIRPLASESLLAYFSSFLINIVEIWRDKCGHFVVNSLKIFNKNSMLCYDNFGAHNPKAGGSNPFPATKLNS